MSVLRATSASISMDFEWGDDISWRTELWAPCVLLIMLPLAKVGGFSTFPSSTHESAYLCSEQEEILMVVIGMMKKCQKHHFLCVSTMLLCESTVWLFFKTVFSIHCTAHLCDSCCSYIVCSFHCTAT